MESELSDLEKATAKGQTPLAFFQFCLGALISTAVSWATATNLSTGGHAIYVGVCLPLAVLSMWFFAQWRREVKERQELFDRIRCRLTAAQ